MSRLTIIVAATKSNGIGQNSRLPWRLPKEMAYFARVTSNAPEGKSNAVVMGRKTWESIPKKFRPLPKRTNIVISRNKDYPLTSSTSDQVYLKENLQAATELLNTPENAIHRTFMIGGATLYTESLAQSSELSAFVDRVLLTRIISPAFECDVFMPDITGESAEESNVSGWKKASHAELVEWVGFEVLGGVQEENGVQYEFQMWTREPRPTSS